MKDKINLIQQVIDQASKAGLFQTVQTAAYVNAAWLDIVKKLAENDTI